MYLHELLPGAFGTDDVLSVGDESLADQRGLALRADEAVVVPMAVLERDETGAADACTYYNNKLKCQKVLDSASFGSAINEF